MDPITSFMQTYNLSPQEFAKMAGVTQQVIRRAVQGLFGQLPPSLENVMNSYDPTVNWHKEYEEFLAEIVLPPLPEDSKSFVDWRYSIDASRLGFCRLFKVQPVIISNYETGSTQHLPHVLWAKLKEHKGLEYANWVKSLPSR